MKKPRKLLVAALTAGALAASAIPIQNAVADSSPASDALSFTVARTVRRLAEGAGVRPTVLITCAPGVNAFRLQMTVIQARPDGTVARSYASLAPTGAACDGTEKRIPVTVLADNLAFNVGPALIVTEVEACTSGGEYYYYCYDRTTFKETKAVTISDPPVPAVVVQPSGAVITEGNRGVTTAEAVVTLNAPSTQRVTIDWRTIDVPSNPLVAKPGSDYIPGAGTLTFEPGETRKTIPISVLGDRVPEEPLLYGEWALIAFSNPSANAVLDTQTFFGLGLVIIVDDDRRR